MNLIGMSIAAVALWFMLKMLAPGPVRGIGKGVRFAKGKRKRTNKARTSRRKASSVADMEAELEILRLKAKEQKLAMELRRVRTRLKDNDHGVTV